MEFCRVINVDGDDDRGRTQKLSENVAVLVMAPGVASLTTKLPLGVLPFSGGFCRNRLPEYVGGWTSLTNPAFELKLPCRSGLLAFTLSAKLDAKRYAAIGDRGAATGRHNQRERSPANFSIS